MRAHLFPILREWPQTTLIFRMKDLCAGQHGVGVKKLLGSHVHVLVLHFFGCGEHEGWGGVKG